jgi:hypothetical protein
VPRYILFFRGKREGDFKGGEGDERIKEEQKTGGKGATWKNIKHSGNFPLEKGRIFIIVFGPQYL